MTFTEEELILLHEIEQKYKDDKHSDIGRLVKLLLRTINNLYYLDGRVDGIKLKIQKLEAK